MAPFEFPAEHRPRRLRIAVVGTGISGLAAAWLLSQRHDVTVYEKENRLGGHSNTVTIDTPEGPVAVDTGFIVYNELNYPNLTALFRHLGVPTKASNMSFAASLDGGRFEYSGSGLFNGLFAVRRNMFRPRMWRMIADIARLYKGAPELADEHDLATKPLSEFLAERGYSAGFQRDHLLPMCAAIWSLPLSKVAHYPTLSFLRFFENHGLMKFSDRPQWRTVDGGSREYVRRMGEVFADRLTLGAGVAEITRGIGQVAITDTKGRVAQFDHVVVGAHSDEALGMLGDPSPAESAVLGALPYHRNVAYLHSDPSLMPRSRKVWSSWNYLGGGADEQSAVCVTYWMNRLQSLPTKTPVFVTLNPSRPPSQDKTFARFDYDHPVFDAGALAAQRQLWSLQGMRNTWYCGAYFGSGFHEDGLQSGLAVAEALGGVTRPWQVDDRHGRIVALSDTPVPPARANRATA